MSGGSSVCQLFGSLRLKLSVDLVARAMLGTFSAGWEHSLLLEEGEEGAAEHSLVWLRPGWRKSRSQAGCGGGLTGRGRDVVEEALYRLCPRSKRALESFRMIVARLHCHQDD